ncbi:MAG: TolC family protein [Clostridiales bacterium]|nr:TolC family protein [Clostridiales bacterium]
MFRKMLVALMLALGLLLLVSGAAWAKDTAQLDYADIALRVPKENKNLDIMQRSLPIMQKRRDELVNIRDGIKGTTPASSGAIASLMQDYQNTMQNSNDPEKLNWALLMMNTMGAMSMMGQVSAGSISTSGIDMQIEQMRIQIPQTEAQLINSGQQLFIAYYQLQDNIKKMKSSRVLLEESLRLAQTQQTAGLGTALAVMEAQLSIAELDAAIKQLENQGAQLLNQLKLIVGWPQIQIIRLGKIPKPNREFPGKADLSQDIQSACDNSYSLKLKQAEHKYTDGDEQKNIIKLTMEAQKEQIALSVSTQHYKMTEANNTLLLEEQRLAVAEQKIKQSRLQYQVGLLAEIALQAEENIFTAQQEAVATAMDALFWEIEKYKTIVAGLN